MTTKASEPVLITVELGAKWPRWMSDLVRQSPRRVISQGEGEGPLAFAERASRVANSLSAGSRLGAAVILCNERTDDTQNLARRQLAEAFQPNLGASGRLLLTRSALAPELHGSVAAPTRNVEFGHTAPVTRTNERLTRRQTSTGRRVAKVA